jgi:hypothetical protein
VKHHPLFRYPCNSCWAGLPQSAATRQLAFKFLSPRLLVFDVTFPNGKAAGPLIVYPHDHRVDLECLKVGQQAVSHATSHSGLGLKLTVQNHDYEKVGSVTGINGDCLKAYEDDPRYSKLGISNLRQHCYPDLFYFL